MTSPVGHAIASLAVGSGATRGRLDWRWLLLLFFSANAADLDFVPGMMIGDANRYHHLVSHSFSAAFLYSLLLGLVALRYRLPALKTALFAGLAYASHLLLDFFTIDAGAPYGMLLRWPFAETFHIAAEPFFAPVEHGEFGDNNRRVISLFLSPANLWAVALEIVVLAPIAAVSWWWSIRKRKRLQNVYPVTE